MAFANLGLMHHLRVALVFIYSGFCLLLLLVVSNPLLCQGCQMPLQNLFDTATTVANCNYRLTREMFSEFDKQYGQGKNFISKVLNSYHTKSITNPDNKEAEHIQVRILSGHRATGHERPDLSSPDHLSKAAEIEEKTKELLEGAEQIQKKIHSEDQDKETSYPVWSEISSLMSEDDDVNKTAFYKMFHCLHKDSSKIDIYLQMLKCQFVSC
ncbi:hypothetical protein FD755_022373 [Muntiacus reevesi]|uniref:Uncharacterized protein n=1 Tax=Muntiacus reevesi TaxID=9886 RepID=A0A5N3W0X5_MUNRE|nr:hypothetical protein FD755_022373 [Muntiacus reevesi]